MTRLSDGSRIEDWNRPIVPVTVEVYEPAPDPQLVVLAQVLDALEGLREALGGLPAPMVHVAPPNMDALVAALASGTPPPSADEIAEAMAARIHQPVDSGPALAETIREAMEKLGKQLQFPVSRPAAGGGSVSLSNDPNRQLGVVTGPVTDAELRAADVKVTLDGETVPVTGTFWQATQPVSNTYLANQVGTHVGVAGTLTSGTATGTGRCIGIRLFASGADASCTVTGVTGTITIRSGTGVDLNLLGTVTAPVVTWVSGTLDYLISGLT